MTPRSLWLVLLALTGCLTTGSLGRYSEADSANTLPTEASDGSAAGVCDGDGDSGTDCSTCLRETCCQDVPDCASDERCSCMYGCISMGTSPLECLASCGNGPISTPFHACALKSCAPRCTPE